MIDKVDVRIPQGADLRSRFQFINRDCWHPSYSGYVRRSQFYIGVIDLRPFGVDAILHAGYRYGTDKDSKLELLQTGKKSLRTMAALISAVFDVSPNELEIMRLDFASDHFDVPVAYLYGTVRVKFKRSQDERGELDYEVVGGRRLEYMRFGKSPNCVRVYDKPAECKARWRAILKKAGKERPTFEGTFGFPADTVLSRIERQAGGGRIPDECNTFGKLYQADRYNPFTNVEVIPSGTPLPDFEQHDPADVIKILGIDALIRQMGMQNARALLNRNGNAKRLLQPYVEYVNSGAAATKLSQERIYEAYRESVRKQIDGGLELPIDSAKAPSIGFGLHETPREYSRVFPEDGQSWGSETARAAVARTQAGDSPPGSASTLGED